MILPSKCGVETLQLEEFCLALLSNFVNRFQGASFFTADLLTRYHHGINHLQHKLIFTRFKI